MPEKRLMDVIFVGGKKSKMLQVCGKIEIIFIRMNP